MAWNSYSPVGTVQSETPKTEVHICYKCFHGDAPWKHPTPETRCLLSWEFQPGLILAMSCLRLITTNPSARCFRTLHGRSLIGNRPMMFLATLIRVAYQTLSLERSPCGNSHEI